MEAEKLYRLIEKPLHIKEDSIKELEILIDQYPFFQVARFLLALAQPTTEHIKQAAIAIPDRNFLKRMIELKINPYKVNFDFEAAEQAVATFDAAKHDAKVETSNKSEVPHDKTINLETNLELEAEQPSLIESADLSVDENKKDLEITSNKSEVPHDKTVNLETNLELEAEQPSLIESADLSVDENKEDLEITSNLESQDLLETESGPAFSIEELITNLNQYKKNFDQLQLDPNSQAPEPLQKAPIIDLDKGFTLDENLDDKEQHELILDFISNYQSSSKTQPFFKSDGQDLAYFKDEDIIWQVASPALGELMLQQKKYAQALITYESLTQKEPNSKSLYAAKINQIKRLQETKYF